MRVPKVLLLNMKQKMHNKKNKHVSRTIMGLNDTDKNKEMLSNREYGMVAPPSAVGGNDSSQETTSKKSSHKDKEDEIRDAEVLKPHRKGIRLA